MASRGIAIALAASALLLAGCTAQPSLPPGPSEGRVAQLIDDQNARWWESIAPGEPRPEVEAVEYVDLDGGRNELVAECMLASGIEGIVL